MNSFGSYIIMKKSFRHRQGKHWKKAELFNIFLVRRPSIFHGEVKLGKQCQNKMKCLSIST